MADHPPIEIPFSEEIQSDYYFEIPKEGTKDIFKIKIANTENNLIIITEINDEITGIDKEYKKIFTLNDIKKVKYFKMYDNLNDCMNDIISGFEDEGINIKEENNSIIITIPLQNIKYPSISFKLNEKIKTDKDIIKEQSIIIKHLKEEIIKLKKENEKLKENFNDKINISIDNTIINNKNNENEITVVVFCFIYL